MRYIPGIVLAQIIAVLLTWLHKDELASPEVWLRIAIPSVAVAIVIGFWLSALAKNANAAALKRMTERHFKERENLRVKAEKDKTRLQRDAQKSLLRESRKVNSRASLKIGAALTGAVAFGVLMLFTQLASLGLILLTGAGGALAGYMARYFSPRSKQRNLDSGDTFVIDQDRNAESDAMVDSTRADRPRRLSLPRFNRSKR